MNPWRWIMPVQWRAGFVQTMDESATTPANEQSGKSRNRMRAPSREANSFLKICPLGPEPVEAAEICSIALLQAK
jgi:hypothetical protein